MNISNDKQVIFLEKLINETKLNNVVWEKTKPDASEIRRIFNGYMISDKKILEIDSEGAFTCEVKIDKVSAFFYLVIYTNMSIHAAITIDMGVIERFNQSDENISVLLSRLFYLVFDRFPSINKFIDLYIKSNPD